MVGLPTCRPCVGLLTPILLPRGEREWEQSGYTWRAELRAQHSHEPLSQSLGIVDRCWARQSLLYLCFLTTLLSALRFLRGESYFSREFRADHLRQASELVCHSSGFKHLSVLKHPSTERKPRIPRLVHTAVEPLLGTLTRTHRIVSTVRVPNGSTSCTFDAPPCTPVYVRWAYPHRLPRSDCPHCSGSYWVLLYIRRDVF